MQQQAAFAGLIHPDKLAVVVVGAKPRQAA